MNNKIQGILGQLLPFIVFGIAIALLIGLFIMISYVLVWGLIFGGIFWIAFVIKTFLFPSQKAKKNSGRVIEHKDIK